jgi:S1-C subfamily serine protease
MSLSHPTRWWLAGLAAVVIGVLAVDGWRGWREPTRRAEGTGEGETRPGATARADTRRGLNETPLLYSGEFARNVVARLAPGLVWAEPATGTPSAGLMVGPEHALIALWSDAREWILTTGAGQRARARLAAVDRPHGVALLALDGARLPALVSGSADALQPAEALLVVRPTARAPGIRTFEWPGSPGAMQELLGESEHLRVIVALDGTVAGLQLPRASGGQWIDGIEMQRIVAALERDGHHWHPWSGLHVQAVDASLAARFGPAALVVTHVEAGSPAAVAGVTEGTVLSSIERGTDHATTEAGARRLLDTPGRVELVAVDGGRYGFDVADRDLERNAEPATSPAPSRGSPRLPAPANRRGVLRPPPGLEVHAEPGSAAATAGLRSGDAVVAIDGVPVASTAVLDRALASGRGLLLKVRRGDGYRYVSLPAAAADARGHAARPGGARR